MKAKPLEDKRNSTIRFRSTVPKKMVLLAALILIISVSIHLYGFGRVKPGTGLNLEDAWFSCNGTYLADNCQWVPEDIFRIQGSQSRHDNTTSLKFRRTFYTPDFCTMNEMDGCSFVIGGVYQGAELSINGKPLGTHFTRADTLPANFKIPSSILQTSSH